ncbi:hypothetical protein Y1Q_0015448 [Alligator mississippiensis]|uniref:Uncharacterized protein n=1 Tax=Alligator mississippiensis TaxID=8496 RepID=A0A151NCX5_ALLMI|nr:hypothetical protein Y1Q_0015448 [Alligator mississippiensis]
MKEKALFKDKNSHLGCYFLRAMPVLSLHLCMNLQQLARLQWQNHSCCNPRRFPGPQQNQRKGNGGLDFNTFIKPTKSSRYLCIPLFTHQLNRQ